MRVRGNARARNGDILFSSLSSITRRRETAHRVIIVTRRHVDGNESDSARARIPARRSAAPLGLTARTGWPGDRSVAKSLTRVKLSLSNRVVGMKSIIPSYLSVLLLLATDKSRFKIQLFFGKLYRFNVGLNLLKKCKPAANTHI